MSASNDREERLQAIVTFVRKTNGWPIAKDEVYSFDMSVFVTSLITAKKDLGDAIYMGWIQWAPRLPGHVVVGPRAPPPREPPSPPTAASDEGGPA